MLVCFALHLFKGLVVNPRKLRPLQCIIVLSLNNKKLCTYKLFTIIGKHYKIGSYTYNKQHVTYFLANKQKVWSVYNRNMLKSYFAQVRTTSRSP